MVPFHGSFHPPRRSRLVAVLKMCDVFSPYSDICMGPNMAASIVKLYVLYENVVSNSVHLNSVHLHFQMRLTLANRCEGGRVFASLRSKHRI